MSDRRRAAANPPDVTSTGAVKEATMEPGKATRSSSKRVRAPGIYHRPKLSYVPRWGPYLLTSGTEADSVPEKDLSLVMLLLCA